MKVVKNSIKIELNRNEREVLRQAVNIIDEFVEMVRNENCNMIFFEEVGVDHSIENYEDASCVLDALVNENPII